MHSTFGQIHYTAGYVNYSSSALALQCTECTTYSESVKVRVNVSVSITVWNRERERERSVSKLVGCILKRARLHTWTGEPLRLPCAVLYIPVQHSRS